MIAYEQALLCASDKTDTRFRLALIYAETQSMKLLGFRHYRILLAQNHLDTGALNNLALLYDEFGLPIEKIRLMKRASDQKEAHAIGNLASSYAEAGFLTEAEELLVNAQPAISSSERVAEVQKYIHKMRSENDENKEKLISDAEKLSAKILNFELEKKINPEAFVGQWVDSSNTSFLEIARLDGYFKATITTGNEKLFGRIWSFSPIMDVGFSSTETPLTLSFLATPEKQRTILIGPKMIRLINIEQHRMSSHQDFSKKGS
jgi:hypothetical protein